MSKSIRNSLLIIFLLVGTILLLEWGISHPQNYSFSSSSIISSKKNNFIPNSEPSLNILALGIAGNGSRGALLTDSIFVTHFDWNKQKIILLSIPRDFLVKDKCCPRGLKINGLFDLENKGKKFNSSCSFHLIQKEIEKILGIKIKYVIVFDLEGVEQLTDKIGGINIYLPQDVADPYLVNPHHPSEIFHLKAGWNYLDGSMVAKFVRTRYAPSGDFYRIQHQHQIIAAFKDKIIQLTDTWHLPSWFKLWQSLRGHYLTNLDFNSVWQIIQLAKKISSDKIQYWKLSNRPPDKLLISTMFPLEGKLSYVLLPRAGEGNYSMIQNFVQKKFNNDD